MKCLLNFLTATKLYSWQFIATHTLDESQMVWRIGPEKRRGRQTRGGEASFFLDLFRFLFASRQKEQTHRSVEDKVHTL